MTTGRINQVTILSRAPEGRGRPPAEQAAEQCTRRAALERPRLGSRSRGCNRFPSTIQLPPLCSPRGGPRHGRSGARRRHRVSHATLRRRLLSAGHAQGGYQPGLAPKCLEENGGHRPVIHRPLRHWRLSPPDFRTPLASSWPVRASGLKPRVLCPPGAGRDSAFAYQSSGSRMGALQLWDTY